MASTATQDKGPQLVAASITLLLLSTIAVALRVWGRLIARSPGLWWDDWLSLAALPFIWSLCALVLYWVSLGFGKHIREVQGSTTQLALVLFVFGFLYNIGLTLVKLSVLMFYRRVFGTTRANMITFWVVGALLLGWCIAINFLNLFACNPIRKYWVHDIPGSCTNSKMDLIVTAVPNIVTDFILLVLPMPLLWRLHMELSRKLALAGVFAVGYCVLVISIIRLAFVVGLEEDYNTDGTYTGVTSTILAMCEVSIALISSCLPSTFSLVKHANDQLLSGLMTRFYKRLTSADMSSGGGRLRSDAVGPPIESHAMGEFPSLHRGAKKPRESNERLFEKNHGTNHDARAWPAMQGNSTYEDTEMGLSLHQIVVREDIDVNSHHGR